MRSHRFFCFLNAINYFLDTANNLLDSTKWFVGSAAQSDSQRGAKRRTLVVTKGPTTFAGYHVRSLELSSFPRWSWQQRTWLYHQGTSQNVHNHQGSLSATESDQAPHLGRLRSDPASTQLMSSEIQDMTIDVFGGLRSRYQWPIRRTQDRNCLFSKDCR